MKRILDACEGDDNQAVMHAATERVRQAFLACGSETPDNLNCVKHIEFGASDGSPIGPPRVRGLRLKNKNIKNVLLSDIMHAAEDDTMPSSVRAAFPNLTDQEWDAV